MGRITKSDDIDIPFVFLVSIFLLLIFATVCWAIWDEIMGPDPLLEAMDECLRKIKNGKPTKEDWDNLIVAIDDVLDDIKSKQNG